jgi:hypothetical protein
MTERPKRCQGKRIIGDAPEPVELLPMWRLVNARGIPVHCAMLQSDNRWLILLRRGPDITFYECCSSTTAAVQRANEIWAVLVERGWTEPRH